MSLQVVKCKDSVYPCCFTAAAADKPAQGAANRALLSLKRKTTRHLACQHIIADHLGACAHVKVP